MLRGLALLFGRQLLQSVIHLSPRRSTGRNNSYVELACGCDPERVYLPVAWPDQWLNVVVSSRVAHGSCTVTLHTDGDAGEWSNFDDVELVAGAAKLSVLGADVSSLKKFVILAAAANRIRFPT